METLSTASQGDSSVKSDDSSPQHESGRSSPPPKCAICLGTCKNKSFTDSCLHQFCFRCILKWSKVKAECPLCKQNFKSIIHNVRSNHQYEEYMVEQQIQVDEIERFNFNTINSATQRYRYRTTLTLPSRDTWALQQLLINYGGHHAPPPHRRRQPSYFRRTVYRHNLWARPLPDFTGRFRDCTPEFYRYNTSQMHRLVPWLNRELHYLLNENMAHISFVVTQIMDLLPRYHINSSEFREALQRYFGDRTEHFLHELFCFASTPYDMAGYDRNIQYTTDSRVSTMVSEVISSSDGDSSIDADISIEDFIRLFPVNGPAGPSRVPAPVYPQTNISNPPNNDVIPIETISHSDSDDGSEVMVVGYIKPPHARTPEVVDLLGSDSDVVIEEDPQPTTAAQQQPQTSQAQESRPLVKFTLKQHHTRPGTARPSSSRPSSAHPTAAVPTSALPATALPVATNSAAEHPSAALPTTSPPATIPPDASESDGSTYTPPLPRRKRQRRPSNSPVRSSSETSSPSKSNYHTPSSSTLSFYSDSSSDCFNARDRRVKRKKTKRKNSNSEKSKKKTKRSKSNSKSKKTKSKPTEIKQTNRKSNSGKGVKSSKSSSTTSTNTSSERIQTALDQPSTSGTQTSNKSDKKKKVESKSSSSEIKRLKSAITVVTNQRHLRSATCSETLNQANSSKNSNPVEEAQNRENASASNHVNYSSIGESVDTNSAIICIDRTVKSLKNN